MKKLFYYLTIMCFSITFASCAESELETLPSDSMSGESLFSNANAALVPLNGIYRFFYVSGNALGGNTQQSSELGYKLMADVMGDDHIMSGQGSGWFWYDCIYNVKSRFTSSAWRPYDIWASFYRIIANTNYIIAAEETMSGEEAAVNYVIGQAYALRAYSYFTLAQTYARTYKGHENDPGVPIYTEPTTAGMPGKPRGTLQETYAQIVSDIDKAVDLLSKASARKHITHIDYPTALGIQARIALTMEDFSKAKTAAETAISKSTCRIGGSSDLLSGMNDVSKTNVMWGAHIIPDQSGMYASFFTHMDADAGYYGSTARKQINKKLYALLGTKDIRRGWWNPNNPNNKNGGYQQVKFRFMDTKTWTGDYIFMRIEEMYLMAAEAACRLDDNETARKHLTDLVKTRDTDYTCTKSGKNLGTLTSDITGSLLEEIINQRRIELWGEYGRIYDIRRLRQGFKRTLEMGWPETALIPNTNTEDPESYAWVLTIPQAEFDGNKSLEQDKDQNPMGDSK